MNTHAIAETPPSAYGHAVGATLSLEDLRHHMPAVFADAASDRTRPTYRFINTHQVLQELLEAGFQVANARQTRTRQGSSDTTYA
jgi:aspartate aminotransferase-like enzyme